MKRLLCLIIFVSSHVCCMKDLKHILCLKQDILDFSFNQKNGLFWASFPDGSSAFISPKDGSLKYEKNEEYPITSILLGKNKSNEKPLPLEANRLYISSVSYNSNKSSLIADIYEKFSNNTVAHKIIVLKRENKNSLEKKEILIHDHIVSLVWHPIMCDVFAYATTDSVYINSEEIINFKKEAADITCKKIQKIIWGPQGELGIGVSFEGKDSRIYILKNIDGKWIIADVYKKNAKLLDFVLVSKNCIVASYFGGDVVFYNLETWKEEIVKTGIMWPKKLAFDEKNNVLAVAGCGTEKGESNIQFLDLGSRSKEKKDILNKQ